MSAGRPVRELLAQDVPACVEVASTVGWSTDPDKWRWMLELGQGYGVDGEDGALAGTLLVLPFGAELAMIAMMIVRATQQQRGIGRRLMEHAIARSGSAVLCLYATELGQKLYRPFGFVDAGVTTRFEGEPRSLPERAVDGLRALESADLGAVIALDATAQGARRERLIASLEAQGREGAFVIERAGQLAAFGMALAEPGARRLGPIVAALDVDAVALADRLALGAQHVRVDLEPGEQRLRAWAVARELAEGESSPRLTRGGAGLPGVRSLSRSLVGRPFG